MWSGAGKRLGEVANGVSLADGTVSACVRRGMLQKTLGDQALDRGIPIQYGKRLDSYAVTDSGVTARFTDGTEVTGDILIGADGIYSRTRQLLNPDAPRPRFTGMLSIGGYSRVPGLPPTTGTQHFVFGKRAFFGYLVREDGEIYWFANLHRDHEPTRRDLAAVSASQWKQQLLEQFADDLPLIGRIIENTTGEIGAYLVHDIPTSPVWHRGPVALIGDAVHATSPSAGQGASMAIEDAVTLARCLRDIPDITTAFGTYESLRRTRVAKVVAYSKTISSSKAAGADVGERAAGGGADFRPQMGGWPGSCLIRHYVCWAIWHRKCNDAPRSPRLRCSTPLSCRQCARTMVTSTLTMLGRTALLRLGAAALTSTTSSIGGCWFARRRCSRSERRCAGRMLCCGPS
jgi:2-polyprenyl-6-methoxyphenol hydroxylase-like FAD-dependent oxidoreductase